MSPTKPIKIGYSLSLTGAQKLLDGVLAGFALEEDGPRYIGTDIAALAWRFGPPGHPVARGIDILTIPDGRVSVVRTSLGRTLAVPMCPGPRLNCVARDAECGRREEPHVLPPVCTESGQVPMQR
jgi:hypothetical protein